MSREQVSLEEARREQLAYYRARAGEYDEWFRRDGRYDRGPEANARWVEEVGQVADALAAFHPTGDVLELAAGTGWWTGRLARYAASVTAVDAAPETLAINRGKLGDAPVRYVEADLFDWQPARRYDVVFFSFWLSHVPPERFDAFWTLVRACLKPQGRVFFLDSRYEETSTAADHRLEAEDATTTRRRLNDGREFRIVKVFYRPDALAARLAARGWDAAVRTTPNYFLYGMGTVAR
jgi:demethylmenaquinone methyltransferase/2-methoxy-6-polyprenyl-1,4-benzoquinol methylase